ncbi:uncharacterized protein K444DRAFT_524117 [Hyaloscypha bicolor E]|uniref:N-acetyltransferase domain-containing protein n=1 Tax=Hyaloscypha bicolor E TaxID=1095630 RepID=A0A2J6TGV3_9HELO|nr:uncharacterized protein K444DRAFT_524117 [Hyaloscypha bicolor E]PMD62255.1 hypothetical protein K444DRAFT_524117 [Hyaloscypha bicolor E]
MDSTTKQSLLLLQAEPSDALEILEMHIAAFTDPYEQGFFLQFPKEEERDKGVKRMVDWWLGDPTATYMKVIDSKTGKIISAAKWHIRKEPPTEVQKSQKLHFDWLPNEDLNDWGEEVYHSLSQGQLARSKDGCCIIDMLSTHPEHQRRGAGSMLVKWGTDIADNLGLKAFVQASRLGKHLYESHGFVDKEGWITVPVSEKHRNKPEVAWFNLERPAKASIIPEAKDVV